MSPEAPLVGVKGCRLRCYRDKRFPSNKGDIVQPSDLPGTQWSSAAPATGQSCPDGMPGAPDGIRTAAGPQPGDMAQILFTPAQAAELLQVRESWLRRRAARRTVPCTFLGKHLRFSEGNLRQIASDAARPVASASSLRRSRRKSVNSSRGGRNVKPSAREEHI